MEIRLLNNLKCNCWYKAVRPLFVRNVKFHCSAFVNHSTHVFECSNSKDEGLFRRNADVMLLSRMPEKIQSIY